MYNYRAAKEKSLSVVNYCNHLVGKYQFDKNTLIKILAFTIIKCNTPGMKSNIRFISLYRHKSVATSEESYYVLMFNKAIVFIENLKQEDLNISKKEFNFFTDEIEKKEVVNKNKS
jgi:hypothetical protein